jgi:predicted nucleotidyltransferase
MPHYDQDKMKNIELKVKNAIVTLKDLKIALEGCPEVSAAYLFGSAASGEVLANDLDILVLLHQETDKDDAYINLIYNLSKSLKIPESYVDLLFFDSNEADPSILTQAVNRGILLVNHDPEYLSNMIDIVSRDLLENEAMITRAQRLRRERTEVFGET